jgi:hypothetical protein
LAKFKIKPPRNLPKNLAKKLNAAAKDDKFLEASGKLVVRDIKAVVSSGKVTFKPLSPATVDAKERLAKFNRVSKFYKKGLANVTFTGQLLKALKHVVLNGQLQIFVANTKRRKLKTRDPDLKKNKDGTRKKYRKNNTSPPTNAEVHSFLKANYFRKGFLNLVTGISESNGLLFVTKQAEENIIKQLRRAIRRQLP